MHVFEKRGQDKNVQDHRRSLISVPIKNAYTTSCQLPRFTDSAGFLFKTATHPYSTRNLGMFPFTKDCRSLGAEKQRL